MEELVKQVKELYEKSQHEYKKSVGFIAEAYSQGKTDAFSEVLKLIEKQFTFGPN